MNIVEVLICVKLYYDGVVFSEFRLGTAVAFQVIYDFSNYVLEVIRIKISFCIKTICKTEQFS